MMTKLPPLTSEILDSPALTNAYFWLRHTDQQLQAARALRQQTVTPQASLVTPSASPIQRYWAAIDQKVAGGMTQSAAILAVMKEQPALIEAYQDYTTLHPKAHAAFMAQRRERERLALQRRS